MSEIKTTGLVEYEDILSDDYLVYAGYCYVALFEKEYRVIIADYSGTVATLKAARNTKEIRNCNMCKRNLFQ